MTNIFERWESQIRDAVFTFFQCATSGGMSVTHPEMSLSLLIQAAVRRQENYLVGTEQGAIHKCSTAYDSDYLQTYGCHFMHVRLCSRVFLEGYCASAALSASLIIAAAWKLVRSPSISVHVCSAPASPICWDICWAIRFTPCGGMRGTTAPSFRLVRIGQCRCGTTPSLKRCVCTWLHISWPISVPGAVVANVYLFALPLT